ncbi:MAG: glycosyltransferase family 2 protein [Gammaproteobacteria bacterium]|nr:MAG: glycosyltransferase family 2 protein [Gammaproteobacteria bacterium]
MENNLSVIIPAKNESVGLRKILPALREAYPDAQVLIVDDGSTDDTADYAREQGCDVLSMRYSAGNGAAIKAGLRAAKGEIVVCMDGEGQHDPADIPRLLEKLQQGYDMAVGARDVGSHASLPRRFGNAVYNILAGWITGQQILDLTSGFRAVRANHFREFLSLLPNGFSYPTTVTMAFFRSGYPVAYVPVAARQREGRSHIRLARDGVRFFMIIFKVGTLYSPLKIFLPISALFFATGCGYYLYTFIAAHRFTNMSALLLVTSVLVFLIGLVSEQITNLIYTTYNRPDDSSR